VRTGTRMCVQAGPRERVCVRHAYVRTCARRRERASGPGDVWILRACEGNGWVQGGLNLYYRILVKALELLGFQVCIDQIYS
jgi:hypothetical protein